jgi:hypothetical protein
MRNVFVGDIGTKVLEEATEWFLVDDLESLKMIDNEAGIKRSSCCAHLILTNN